MRHDITGGINFDQCSEVMKQSRKIITILSNSFLRESECLAEATYAGKVMTPCTIHNEVLEAMLDD